MGKVFLSITMSLDGFVAGCEISQENPMGLNGQLLHKWLFADKQKEDEEVASDMFKNCGAVILGSTTYTTAIDGVWQSQSPFPVPAFVLSSKKLQMAKGFTVVGDGIISALTHAKYIAKEKDILVMGGASTAQQFLAAGLLDELRISIAPIILNSGTRLFEKGNNQVIELSKIKVAETSSVTHLVLKPIRKARILSLLFILLAFIASLQSCNKSLIEAPEPTELRSKISDYLIFTGTPSDLVPNGDYKLYELSSQLFTDYAEKQRLVRIPPGTSTTAMNNGLLEFPNGTILVKTFFYYHDKRDRSRGKRVIETRLLAKANNKWTAGTYLWNNTQTDASLITTGLNMTVNWIDDAGAGNVISYHIPDKNECATCHNSNHTIIPIGLKVRNLNMEVVRNSITQNQLSYLHDENILNAVNPSSFIALPNYKDTSFSLLSRARAYFDMNCAHCHTETGFASNKRLRMDYETSLEETKITHSKGNIVYQMENEKMPKIGTTVVDKEGLTLIRNFIDSLKSN